MLTLEYQPPPWTGRYVGRPYEPVVWDCWALFWHVLTEQAPVPVDLPRHDEVAALPVADRAGAIGCAVAGSEWIEIAPGREQLFDAALIRWRGHAVHVAPIVAIHTILNVAPGRMTQLEPLYVAWQPNRLEAIYRHRRLAS